MTDHIQNRGVNADQHQRHETRVNTLNQICGYNALQHQRHGSHDLPKQDLWGVQGRVSMTNIRDMQVVNSLIQICGYKPFQHQRHESHDLPKQDLFGSESNDCSHWAVSTSSLSAGGLPCHSEIVSEQMRLACPHSVATRELQSFFALLHAIGQCKEFKTSILGVEWIVLGEKVACILHSPCKWWHHQFRVDGDISSSM